MEKVQIGKKRTIIILHLGLSILFEFFVISTTTVHEQSHVTHQLHVFVDIQDHPRE